MCDKADDFTKTENTSYLPFSENYLREMRTRTPESATLKVHFQSGLSLSVGRYSAGFLSTVSIKSLVSTHRHVLFPRLLWKPVPTGASPKSQEGTRRLVAPPSTHSPRRKLPRWPVSTAVSTSQTHGAEVFLGFPPTHPRLPVRTGEPSSGCQVSVRWLMPSI